MQTKLEPTRFYIPDAADKNQQENPRCWLSTYNGDRKKYGRKYQEDRALHGNIPQLALLSHEDRAVVIKETFAQLQAEILAKSLWGGSTVQIAICVYELDGSITLYTGTCGDSEALLLSEQTRESKTLYGFLHGLEEMVADKRPELKNLHYKPAETGEQRLKNTGLNMGRSLGDRTAVALDGLSSELDIYTLRLPKDAQTRYVSVGSDGIFHRHIITQDAHDFIRAEILRLQRPFFLEELQRMSTHPLITEVLVNLETKFRKEYIVTPEQFAQNVFETQNRLLGERSNFSLLELLNVLPIAFSYTVWSHDNQTGLTLKLATDLTNTAEYIAIFDGHSAVHVSDYLQKESQARLETVIAAKIAATANIPSLNDVYHLKETNDAIFSEELLKFRLQFVELHQFISKNFSQYPDIQKTLEDLVLKNHLYTLDLQKPGVMTEEIPLIMKFLQEVCAELNDRLIPLIDLIKKYLIHIDEKEELASDSELSHLLPEMRSPEFLAQSLKTFTEEINNRWTNRQVRAPNELMFRSQKKEEIKRNFNLSLIALWLKSLPKMNSLIPPLTPKQIFLEDVLAQIFPCRPSNSSDQFMLKAIQSCNKYYPQLLTEISIELLIEHLTLNVAIQDKLKEIKETYVQQIPLLTDVLQAIEENFARYQGRYSTSSRDLCSYIETSKQMKHFLSAYIDIINEKMEIIKSFNTYTQQEPARGSEQHSVKLINTQLFTEIDNYTKEQLRRLTFDPNQSKTLRGIDDTEEAVIKDLRTYATEKRKELLKQLCTMYTQEYIETRTVQKKCLSLFSSRATLGPYAIWLQQKIIDLLSETEGDDYLDNLRAQIKANRSVSGKHVGDQNNLILRHIKNKYPDEKERIAILDRNPNVTKLLIRLGN